MALILLRFARLCAAGGAHIMLMVLSLVRLLDLRKFHTYRSMFKISGPSRLSHHCAAVVAGILVLLPLMQLSARVAQGIFFSEDVIVAPYEIFGAKTCDLSHRYELLFSMLQQQIASSITSGGLAGSLLPNSGV